MKAILTAALLVTLAFASVQVANAIPLCPGVSNTDDSVTVHYSTNPFCTGADRSTTVPIGVPPVGGTEPCLIVTPTEDGTYVYVGVSRNGGATCTGYGTTVPDADAQAVQDCLNGLNGNPTGTAGPLCETAGEGPVLVYEIVLACVGGALGGDEGLAVCRTVGGALEDCLNNQSPCDLSVVYDCLDGNGNVACEKVHECMTFDEICGTDPYGIVADCMNGTPKACATLLGAAEAVVEIVCGPDGRNCQNAMY